MPYFCPNCQCPISSTKLPADEIQELKCPDCRSQWMRDELQEEDTLAPGTRLGGFEILEPLGVGGMGQVYLAKQLSLDREVALKTLPSELAKDAKAMKRFLQEVRHTAALEHRSIITVFEAGTEEGVGYLAMDYVDGTSLDRMMKRSNQPIAQSEVLRVARAVADALRHAWKRQRLLHRDVKPANIMIDKGGRVRLLDLGIAKRTADTRSASATASALTQKGMAIGTPHYMSPEQARGEPNLDTRSDQYALGATMYHALTGKRPFEGTSVVDILAQQINRDPKPLAKVNRELKPGCIRIVERMMQKKREDRFETWSEVIAALDSLQQQGHQPRAKSVRSRKAKPRRNPISPVEPVVPGQRGTPGRIALLVALLLVVTVLAAVNILLPDKTQAATDPTTPPQIIRVPAKPVPAPPKPQPEPTPDVASMVADAVAAGHSPIFVADRFARKGDDENFVAALETVISDAPGDNAKWARAAATRLEAHYRKTDNRQALEKLLLARLEPAHPDDSPLPEDFLRAADLYDDTNRPKDAERLLWGGLRYGADKSSEVAAVCAERLATAYRTAGDRSQLRLLLHHAIDALPIDNPTRDRLLAERRQLDGEPEESPVEPVAPPVDAELQQLAELVDKAADDSEKSQLRLRYARMLQRRERFEDAAAQFRELIAAAPTAAGKAQLTHELARCYKAAGEDAARLELLAELAESPATPELVAHATTAARLLAKYYEAQNNPFLRNRYLLDIAERYGKADPMAASDALFQVAAWHEKRGRPRTALDVLRRIPAEFTGAGTDTITRAEREIARLEAAHPTIDATPKPEITIPADTISLDGLSDYLRMGRAVSAVSRAKAVTISLWLFAGDQQGRNRPIVSRFNPHNNRGFHLAMEYDRNVSFTIGNGTRTGSARGGIKIPVDKWTHVAAQAGDGKLTVFVDGKVAGIGVYPNDIELDGAGRLHVGRGSWEPGPLLQAWLRYVTVYPEIIYDEPFEPTQTPQEFGKAAICITKRGDRIGDLKRNPVDQIR